MNEPKVGDYIRILVDYAYGTTELAGTKLKILTVEEFIFTTETNVAVSYWTFNTDFLGKGKIELVTSHTQSNTAWDSFVPTGTFTLPSSHTVTNLYPSLEHVGPLIINELIKTSKCECGSAKTYGENCGPELHSLWCPRSKA